MSQLKSLMEKNFLDYASYVIIDRAIPDLRDGLKPVQRRILYTMREMHDGKFHKVANVIGETMKLHPHGDASIGDALVLLANKEYFIEKQGNFGNPLTGHGSAASRYIECRLTSLALDTLFNRHLTKFVSSYDGRKNEPYQLPAKVPVLLMLGTEGIAVGMSTRILPHNFIELLDAQVKILQQKPFSFFPDFFQGGQIDISEYDDGAGKIRVRAKIEVISDKKLVIREIPYSTTTESLISSIESASQKGRVSISSIKDFTTDEVEIELVTSRGVSSEEVLPQLYVFTDCEISISSNIVAIKNDRPVEITVSQYLLDFTSVLKKQIKAELEFELDSFEHRLHWLTLEQIFIENRVYKRIETAKTEKKIRIEVKNGMAPFSDRFIRPMTEEDTERLLEIRIRRISAYDIDKHREEEEKILLAIEECKGKLGRLTKTTIEYIESLADKYRETYPRRTVCTVFDSVEKSSVAKANIKLSYDPNTGFFGSSVKGTKFHLSVSEYERVLALTKDGAYRIITPPEKVLFSKRLIFCVPFDPETGVHLYLIYRDDRKTAWGKHVHIEKFITDKVYQLTENSPGGIDYLSTKQSRSKIRLHFVPKKRQKIKMADVSRSQIKPCGITARGTLLHPKPVSRIEVIRPEEGN